MQVISVADELEARLEQARTQEGDGLAALLHDPHPDVLASLLANPHLQEMHVRVLVHRADLPAAILESIAREPRWIRSEPVRLGLVQHPHTPRLDALTLLRQLFVFDLVRVCMHPAAPPEIRRVAEELLAERASQLPTAGKLTLARRGPARVAGALLAEGHADVLPLVLVNPFLNEAQVLRVLARTSTPKQVIVAVAEHSKWGVRYNVRLALLRSAHTPVAAALQFLPNLLLPDLRELLRAGGIATHLREHVKREIARRGGVSLRRGLH
jgi:hypothetical protein